MQRAFAAVTAKLPHGWGDLGRQIVLLIFVDLAYETVRGISDGKATTAFANGQRVMDAQAAFGTFFEPGFQAFFLQFNWLMDVANQIYMNSQFAVVVAFFFWLYFFRNDAFYFVRNMFIAAMGLALVGYTLYPTAPPRLFPEYGFVDTINSYSSVNHESALAKLFINPYAAVPSMHCAFAAMLGLSCARLVKSRPLQVFWASWPLVVAWVVIVTANHYWLDVAAGWAVAGLSLLVALKLAQTRPEAWAFRRAAAQDAV